MFNRLISNYLELLSKLSDLPPLILRLILAYGFYEPAMQKISNINAVIEWFGNDLHYPFPALNAYLAVATETTGFVLLFLGLGVRFITIPLMVTMVVAITTVHWENGFSAAHNGFEIPFYYLFMLFTLLIIGAGRMSLDYVIKTKFGKAA